MDKWIDALEYSVGLALFLSPDNAYFYMYAGAGTVFFLFFGHLLATYVAGSKEDAPNKVVAFLLPGVLALACMSASHLFLEPAIKDAQTGFYATAGIGILVYILAGIFFGGKLLSASRGYTFIVLVFACAAAISGVILTKTGMEALDIGKSNVQRSGDRFKIE